MIFNQPTEAELARLSAIDREANRSPWTLHSYQESFEDQNHHFVCLRNEDEIIGCCVYSMVLNEAEILQLVIKRAQQNNGYGYLLFKHVCDKLSASNIEQIFLEVMVGNTSAINLYHKLGFNIVGNRKNYYHVDGKYIDAILMAKTFFNF